MSKPEDLLAFQLKAAGVWFVREHKLIHNRNFRFDFMCSPDKQTGVVPVVMVEVQGGIWKKGGHSTGIGITRDCEKFSLAAAHGYRVLPVTPAQIKSGQALMWIECALGLRSAASLQSPCTRSPKTAP